MSIKQMRQVLADIYGWPWVDLLPDNKVYAIYMRKLNSGELEKKEEVCHQITLDEYMYEKEKNHEI